MAEDEFRELVDKMRGWPEMEGCDSTCKASRAAKALVGNEDVLDTLRHLFLKAPLAPMIRTVVVGVVNGFDAEIVRLCRRRGTQK